LKLWLCRHAPAGFGSNDPRDEAWRGLTDGGRNIAEAIGRAMLEAGEVPKIVLASDHQRACETARIIATIMGVRVDDLDELKPALPIAPLVANFLNDDGKKRLMIVAHSDNLQTFASQYCGDDELFAKGEVRRYEVDRDSGEGTLKWQLRPSDLGFVDEYETPLAGTPEAADADMA
jgi:phosphohistidine phosphatase SixA